MQNTLEDIVQTLSSALVAPGSGSAELILGILVACGFLASAIWSIFAKGDQELEWWERR